MRRLLSIIFLVLASLVILTPAAMGNPPEMSRYIVVLHNDVASPGEIGRQVAQQAGGQIGFIYEHAIKGFSIHIPEQALDGIKRNPNVKYVEVDSLRYAFEQTLPTGVKRIFADSNKNIEINSSDDWRVDVDVAVIDTGIDFEHPDLNISGGVNCTGRIFRAKCEPGGDDDHYHGTHVAGIIGALDNGFGVVGVAPGARLFAVKVLDKNGSGWSSWIIAGIDWVAANSDTIEVANMSLGGSGYSLAEYDAIQGAVNKGVAFAVAAGNEDDDANNYSPSAFNNVLCVSALADFDGLFGGLADPTCREDQDDTLADFSNWGPEVDIAAPGVCILSTYPIERGSYGTISGTSMASPHAAGALALLASGNNKPYNSDGVFALYDKVTYAGNNNWMDDSGDEIQEPLLDVSGFIPALIATGGTTNTPPSVNITAPANEAQFGSGSTIYFSGTASDTEDGDLSASLIWTSSLDGQIGTGGSFDKVLSDGSHTITASVSDSGGLQDNAQVTVKVNGTNNEIFLSVRAYKIKATKYADLTWSGAKSENVDIYRDGTSITTTENDGTYTDGPLGKLTKSATYKVCEKGTTACSNSVTVTW